MTVSGLENNYYLAGNDIWIQVSNFPKVPIRLELKCTNLNTTVTMPVFRLYANTNNIFRFNISQVIRPLQPVPNHVVTTALQNYKIEFLVVFEDNTSESLALEKYFIRGGRVKNNVDEWYLSNGYPLVIAKWVDWRGIILPSQANKIQNDLIVEYIPPATETFKMLVPSICNAKIVKFLNSLGGYQYWVFETYEMEKKVRGKQVVSRIPMRLRDDSSLNIGTDSTSTINLKTKTPAELQPIILDLLDSPEVMIYDPLGVDAASSWFRLQLASNNAILNSNDMSYLNEIEYNIPNYINRDL